MASVRQANQDMMLTLPLAVEVLTTLLTLVGLGYLVMALVAAHVFTRVRTPSLQAPPPTISVLKPIKGIDPGMYQSFASVCRQQYTGRFELLLGVSEADRTVDEEIARLQREFPEVPVRRIHCPARLGLNGKVSTLAQMVPEALGDVLVINDADIRVGPRYLEAIAATLTAPGVAMATVPYFGRTSPKPTFGARLEALGISTEFMPGLLAARMVERGIRFGLGSTLALRRDTLASIGGMEALLDEVADDYELGVRVHRSGGQVVLMPEIVETSVPQYSAGQFWQHQVRWARTVRHARPWSYLGLLPTYALPLAVLNIVAAGAPLWSFSLFSLVLLARVTLALSVGVGVLRDGQVLRDILWLPVRDAFSLLLWAWSFASNNVIWRGEHFRLRSGRMERIRNANPASAGDPSAVHRQ